jgi:hypothetical protein
MRRPPSRKLPRNSKLTSAVCTRGGDDYAIVDDTTVVGRIYREMIIGKPKWRWFIHQIPEAGPGRPIAPPNQGMADTLD